MRTKTVSIELTGKEMALIGACTAMATIVLPHPEIIEMLDEKQAEIFARAAVEILKSGDEFSLLLEKMVGTCHKAQTDIGC